MDKNTKFDVIVIGGSYAGLSAAMALGRALRNVLVIDSGLPCNRQTPHSHNFLYPRREKTGENCEKGHKRPNVTGYVLVCGLRHIFQPEIKIQPPISHDVCHRSTGKENPFPELGSFRRPKPVRMDMFCPHS